MRRDAISSRSTTPTSIRSWRTPSRRARGAATTSAYLNRGTPRNLEILDEVVALRHELAALYELPSFAHFVLRRRMAGTPEAVENSSATSRPPCEQVEQRDLEELRALKAAADGHARAGGDGVPLGRALSQRAAPRAALQRRSGIAAAYFPPTPTLDWLLDVSGALYGLRFEAGTVPVWHDEVLYYDVHDARRARSSAAIYFDLYPREGKFPHAAAWPVRGVSRRAGRTPISVLVTNFDRRGLTHDEVETLFHEFGHVLHGVLSETDVQLARRHERAARLRRGAVADLRGVDAPAREPRTACARSRPDSPPMDAGLVERARSGAASFGQGMLLRAPVALRVVRHRADAARRRDARWTSGSAWRAPPSLGHVAGTAFPGTFAHIVGGYAAGYYGYMWAEVHRARHAVGVWRRR